MIPSFGFVVCMSEELGQLNIAFQFVILPAFLGAPLQVAGLPALDEPLLALLIALARHSTATAGAVRDCPRLLPALRSIFVGLPGPAVRSSLPSQAAQAKAVKLLTVRPKTESSQNLIRPQLAPVMQSCDVSWKRRFRCSISVASYSGYGTL